MTREAYKVGICTDGRRHAVIRKRLQRRALCGAGRIVLPAEGEFDPDGIAACPHCSRLVTDPARV